MQEATLKYFELCLQISTKKTVFDDIYWSVEILILKLSIDLYKMGIVFFKKNSAKQHFILKY